MTKVIFNIPTINCGHCVMTIKNELSEMDGVSSVEGDPAAKSIVVTFDTPASEDTIKALLTEINYPVAS